MSFERIARHSDSDMLAEESLLDGLFAGEVDLDDALKVFSKINRESFSDTRLGLVFEAGAELFTENPKLLDPYEAYKRLRDSGRLKEAGGPSFITDIFECSVTSANVLHWAEIVASQARRRRLAEIGSHAIACASDPSSAVEAGASILSSDLSDLLADGGNTVAVPVKSMIKAEFKAIEQRTKSGEGVEFITTGFADLDRLIGGFTRGELTILAGRPSMGKTALALAYAMNVARSGKHVLMFSLEMSAEQVTHRLIAMESGISSRELRDPAKLLGEKSAALSKAITSISVDTLSVVDSSRLTASEIRAAVQAKAARVTLGLVVIDYLQLIRVPERGHSREREVADISSELKAIAKDMKVPVLCLAQLNRATEQQQGRRPQLSNLRESGSIEQDADVVQFIHRDEYYEKKKENAGKGVIIVAKNRNGETADAEVAWHKERTLFTGIETRRTPPQWAASNDE